MDFLENLRHLRLTPKKKKPLEVDPDPFGAHRRRSSLRSRLSLGSASSLLKLPGFAKSASRQKQREIETKERKASFRGDVASTSLASSSFESAEHRHWEHEEGSSSSRPGSGLDSFRGARHNDDLHSLLEENSSRCSSRILSPLSPSLDTSCPSCLRAYDSSRHRKLIDSRCNHARCYECLFREDECRMCNRLGAKAQLRPQQHGSPGRSSGGSGGRGRESGFQSYAPSVMSINSALPMDDLQSQYSFSMGSEFSEAASEMMLSRTDYKRRSLCSFRTPTSLGSRRSLARRSVFLPSVSRVGEMDSIRESNGVLFSPSSPSPSSSSSRFAHSSPKTASSSSFSFVGRKWLFKGILDHLSTELPTNGGIILTGRPGTGKTSVIKQIERGGYSNISYLRALSTRVISCHYLSVSDESSCLVYTFVSECISQLRSSQNFCAYDQLLTSDESLRNLTSPESVTRRPLHVFLEGVVKPLKQLRMQGKLLMSFCLILVDGLCEGEQHRTDRGETIAVFVENLVQSGALPDWIKFVCSLRTEMAEHVVKRMPFQRYCLDDSGFDERLSKDMKDYLTLRLTQSRTDFFPAEQCRFFGEEDPVQVLLEHLARRASGNFLYAKMTLDLLERGRLVLKSASFSVLPQSLAEVFSLEMNLLFHTRKAFEGAKRIFSVCLATLKPLTLQELEQCCRQDDESEREFLQLYDFVAKFLPRTGGQQHVTFFHASFRDWLIGKQSVESNKFACDAREGHTALAMSLSRRRPEAGLGAEDTLDLAHHVLKAQLMMSRVEGVGEAALSPKELQAVWLTKCAEDVTEALRCPRNLAAPNCVVSRLLLLAGANARAKTKRDRHSTFETSLLHCFAEDGDVSMVRLLLEFGADVNGVDSEGNTPLMLAATKSDGEEIVQIIVEEFKAVINCTSNSGATAVSLAAERNSLSCLKKLLSLSWPESGGFTKQACVQETLAISSKLSLDAFKILLSPELGNGDINEASPVSNQLPLTDVLSAGDVNIVRALITSFGADLSLLKAPLHLAINAGHWSVVDLLLRSGCAACERDAQGRPSLAAAAAQGEVAIMELLLLKGADVNARDGGGMTALSWACVKSKVASVRFLLREQTGADISALDSCRRSCLHHAAMMGSEDVVNALLEAGADIEAEDKNGIRPIDQAINYGNRQTVICILRKGAKLGPTTWAMAKGKPVILLTLLNKLLEDGNTLYLKGRFPDASQRYEYALKRLPESSSLVQHKHSAVFFRLRSHLLLNLSRTLRRLGDFPAAVNRATQALDLGGSSGNPSYEALWARAKALSDLGSLNEALADVREAIKVCPSNMDLHRFAVTLKTALEAEEKKKKKKVKEEKEEKKAD